MSIFPLDMMLAVNAIEAIFQGKVFLLDPEFGCFFNLVQFIE
jgi:hypothetical protein